MTQHNRPNRSSSASARWAGLGLAASIIRINSFIIPQTLPGLRKKASTSANSAGSYLLHRPWLPRKVGMPLSAEMPAPVKATVLLDWKISRAVSLIKLSSTSFLLFPPPGRGRAGYGRVSEDVQASGPARLGSPNKSRPYLLFFCYQLAVN